MGKRIDRRQAFLPHGDSVFELDVPSGDTPGADESEPLALASRAVHRGLPWTAPVDGVLYIEIIRAEEWRFAPRVGG